MEIRSIQNFTAPLIDPPLFFHLLAVRTVPVAAGAVVNAEKGTVIAERGMKTHGRCFAGKNGICSLSLDMGDMVVLAIRFPVFQKNITYGRISHGNHLLDQTD